MTARPTERDAMQRALALAQQGPRGVNPQVGAVLLSPGGDILSEGWHRGAGTDHAEIMALKGADPVDAQGATMVVTLEPCAHTGRTAPCVQALERAGVARVLYSVPDPNPVSSGGAELLRGAGVAVTGDVLATEGHELLESWLFVQRNGRPHVTAKWAQSVDGRTAAADGSSQWITGAGARDDVHRRRSEADAIIVGTGTVRADNPALTARAPDGALLPDQPRPVVIGMTDIPDSAAVFSHPLPAKVYPTHDLPAVLTALAADGAQRVFVEGGPGLHSAFVRANLVDELVVYLAPLLLGGPHTALADIGVTTLAEARRFTLTHHTQLGDDLCMVMHPDRE